MKIGIVILCRFSSSRLPGKILMSLSGRSVLGHILDRVMLATPLLPVVVATSLEKDDDGIEDFCIRSGVPCFRGSLEDVAGRFISCAEHMGWDYVIRINGDNLFLDKKTLRDMVAIAETELFDLVTNVPGRTFPYGMSVEIFNVDFYREHMCAVQDPKHREHVTSWFYENNSVGSRYVFENTRIKGASGAQLALDTEKDLEMARRLVDEAGPNIANMDMEEIYPLATGAQVLNPWSGKFGPLLIAEVGGNHEGSFEAAKKMAISAINAGADIVKFQIYTGDTLVSPVESPSRNAHFKRFELSPNEHIQLAELCRNAGVGYLASVWDLEMLEWIDPYMDVYKVGSGDLTAWPLLEEFARRGKPILLSTGLANLDEVLQAVAKIQSVDARYRHPYWLCLLQCTSMYPIDDSDAHLNVMETLRAKTGLSVGYSDHTVGPEALKVATAMGASALEFHFTDEREGKTFRDHQVSLTESEVSQLAKDIKRIKKLQGGWIKSPQKIELDERHEISFRRAAYLRRSMHKGELVEEKDLVFLRPNHGTDARDYRKIVGAKLLRDVAAFAAIKPMVDYEPK